MSAYKKILDIFRQYEQLEGESKEERDLRIKKALLKCDVADLKASLPKFELRLSKLSASINFWITGAIVLTITICLLLIKVF